MARQWPLPEGTYRISSRFAGRTNPVTGKPENHSGTDFAAPDGTPFYAVQAGTVKYIGAASGYGQWIVVDSDDDEGGGCAEYGHMWNAASTGLKVGDKVKAGQLLGYVGSNGQSTGPHLHLTIWKRAYGGVRVDPETWLAGKPHPPKGGGTASGSTSSPPKTGGTSMSTIFGVDVSYFQDGMSLKKAAAEGIQFAIIRTTDGTFRDRCYQSHLDDAESAGLITAAYHYLRNPNEGTSIAQQVAASLSVMGNKKRPIWLDCENARGLTVEHIKEFKRRFNDAGVHVPGIYTYVPWWEGKVIGGEPDIDKHGLGHVWVAAYGTNPTGSPKSIYPGDTHRQWSYPLGNKKPSMWQFGSNATVAGFNVDINAFKGTKDQVRDLFYGTITATQSEEDDMFSDNDRLMLSEIRNQLTGSHKAKEFPGWPQLGGLTPVDALALILDQMVGYEKDEKTGEFLFNGWKKEVAGNGGKTLIEAVAELQVAMKNVQDILQSAQDAAIEEKGTKK